MDKLQLNFSFFATLAFKIYLKQNIDILLKISIFYTYKNFLFLGLFETNTNEIFVS